MPFSLARCATSSPTARARAVLSPSPPRSDESSVDADASVWPARSSTTCAGMCRVERVTTSRGRAAVPLTFLRTRKWRRPLPIRRDSEMFIGLLTRLPDLAADVLAGVADTLALVRLRLADLADVRGDLADLLLVDAAHDEAGRGLDLERDALGRLHRHRVAEPERELQAAALGDDAVADAHDLQRLLVALGDAGDHVGDERTGQAVAGPALPLVVRTGHDERAVVAALD